jgi:hypothetical protein
MPASPLQVAELAEMLSVDLGRMQSAVSVACWLRFALRLPRPDNDRISAPSKGLYKADSEPEAGDFPPQGSSPTAAGGGLKASEDGREELQTTASLRLLATASHNLKNQLCSQSRLAHLPLVLIRALFLVPPFTLLSRSLAPCQSQEAGGVSDFSQGNTLLAEGAAVSGCLKAIALVVDATVTSYLMMGNLPGLKRHAVSDATTRLKHSKK